MAEEYELVDEPRRDHTKLAILALLAAIIGMAVALVLAIHYMNDDNSTASKTPGLTQVIQRPAEPKFASNTQAAGGLVGHMGGGSASCVKGEYNIYSCEYKNPQGQKKLMDIRVSDKTVVIVENHQ